MRSRSHTKKHVHSDLTAYAANWPYEPVPFVRPYKLVSVPAYLPRSIANQARREIYTYPTIKQRRLTRRALRLGLITHGDSHYLREPWHKVRVRIRLPLRLPLARGSKVALRRGQLVIHSAANLRRQLERRELNRRRYMEGKGNHRSARHGQLDSPGATRFGLVKRAYEAGFGIKRIADAALVARAIGGF